MPKPPSDYYRKITEGKSGVRKVGEPKGIIHDTKWTQIIPHFRVEEGGRVISVKQSDGSTAYRLEKAEIIGETVIDGRRPYTLYPKRRKPEEKGFETKIIKTE